MRKYFLFSILLFLVVATLFSVSHKPAVSTGFPNTTQRQMSLPALYRQVSPTVVWIGAKTVDWIMEYSPTQPVIKWEGTGFLISENGLIATAGHVIRDTDSFEVMFQDGTRAEADFVHMESLDRCDVGFIQLRDEKKYPYLKIDTEIDIGEAVAILGYPWGSNETVSITSGIVAALKHDWYPYLKLSLFVDVASYPGNSGSPIFNMNGKVIGILVGGPHENESYSMCTPAKILEFAMQKALAEIGLRNIE